MQSTRTSLPNPGYIDVGINKAAAINIKELRQPKPPKENTNIIPFVTTHNPNNINIYQYFLNSSNILTSTEHLNKVFQTTKFINSKRQAANLKHQITNAKFSEAKNIEYCVAKCHNSRCKCCQEIRTGTTFNFHKVGKIFTINHNFNCNTRNLIYVLSCRGCDEYYIGETEQELKNRLNLHRSGGNHLDSGHSLYVNKHISECAIGLQPKYNIFPFYKCKTNSTENRRIKEQNFIDKYKPSLNR